MSEELNPSGQENSMPAPGTSLEPENEVTAIVPVESSTAEPDAEESAAPTVAADVAESTTSEPSASAPAPTAEPTGAVSTAAPVAAPEVEEVPAAPVREERRGPSGYIESEGGRPSRIGSGVKPSDVDYKNIALLSRFLDRRGRILSRRKTRVTAKVQRRVAQSVKRARHLALLPYTSDQTRVVRKRR